MNPLSILVWTTMPLLVAAGYEVTYSSGSCAAADALMVREFKNGVCIDHMDGTSSKFDCLGDSTDRFRMWSSAGCSGEPTQDVLAGDHDECMSVMVDDSAYSRKYTCDVGMVSGTGSWYFERTGDNTDNQCRLHRSLYKSGGAFTSMDCAATGAAAVPTRSCFMTGIPMVPTFASGCAASLTEAMGVNLAIPNTITGIDSCITETWNCLGASAVPETCETLESWDTSMSLCLIKNECCDQYTTLVQLLNQTHMLPTCSLGADCSTLPGTCDEAISCLEQLTNPSACLQVDDWETGAHGCMATYPCCGIWDKFVDSIGLPGCAFSNPGVCAGATSLHATFSTSLFAAVALALLALRA